MDLLQYLLLLKFTYVYEQNYQLSWRQAILENIGPSPRASKPMKMDH